MKTWEDGRPVLVGWYWMRTRGKTKLGHIYNNRAGRTYVGWQDGLVEDFKEARITHYISVQVPPFPGESATEGDLI